jgi:hypothetical protein
MKENREEKAFFRAAWDGWSMTENVVNQIVREEMSRYGNQVKIYTDPETDEDFDFSDNHE